MIQQHHDQRKTSTLASYTQITNAGTLPVWRVSGYLKIMGQDKDWNPAPARVKDTVLESRASSEVYLFFNRYPDPQNTVFSHRSIFKPVYQDLAYFFEALFHVWLVNP